MIKKKKENTEEVNEMQKKSTVRTFNIMPYNF